MGRLSQTFKVCLAFLFAVLSTNLLPVYTSALVAPVDNTSNILSGSDTVSICHSQASATGGANKNPYVAESPNYSGVLNGHADIHNIEKVWFDGTTEGWGDIVPPFYYKKGNDTLHFAGLNWTTDGQAIYSKDCVVQLSDEPVAPTVTLIRECGMYGSVTLPQNTDMITYKLSGATGGEGSFTVTATPAQNVSLDVNNTDYILQDNGTAIYSGDLGEYEACEQPPALVECESFQLIEATNKDLNGWTLGENASFVNGGMKLDVTGNWDTTSITRSLTGELKDLGTGVDFAPNVDYLGLHVKTSAGTLTYEKFYENQDPANTGKWWSESNFNVAGGQGYATFDTLENIVAANPGVTLENVRVLYTHPNVSSTIVTSVKIGCKEYTFDFVRDVQACSVEDKMYRDSWMFDGYTYPEADDYSGKINNATYEFTDEGLHLSTPDVPSYVFGLIDGGNTALADVDAMGYKTFRKSVSGGVSVTQPAYVVLVDMNGAAADGETYLIYEPYNNYPNADLEDTWQTWDAYNGGNAKWWDASVAGQQLHSWQYFVDNNPDAVVLAYGFNQGTYNAETYSIVQDITFDCATTSFAAPQVLGDNTSTPVVPVTPVVAGTSTAAAVLPAELPATGAESNQYGLLLAIVLGAASYLVVLRRQEA